MRNPPLYFLKLIKELNNTNITKKFEISKYLWKYFVFFVADPGFEPGQSNYCLGVMSPTFYHYTNPQCYLLRRVGFEPTTSGLWDQRATRLLYPAMFSYDGRSRTSISYWTTFMKNNLPLPPFDIISWRKYTTSLSHHSIHLSVMFVNIKTRFERK